MVRPMTGKEGRRVSSAGKFLDKQLPREGHVCKPLATPGNSRQDKDRVEVKINKIINQGSQKRKRETIKVHRFSIVRINLETTKQKTSTARTVWPPSETD